MEKLKNPGILDDADREFFHKHYEAIASRLLGHRYWRNNWTVEIDGCVFKFRVVGYAKRGSPVWEDQQEEIRRVSNE